jgi:fructose-1,6-bisphosphatase/inositol monophosphatase family enzyme
MRKENIFNTVARMEKISNDLIESAGKGFAFPVAEKIRNISENEISKIELLKTSLKAIKDAWENNIEPRIDAIRESAVAKDQQKDGNDFFTQADIASEDSIRGIFFEKYGEDNIRVFGEESGSYLGNLNSTIGIRIDPIDGTESMKYGKTQDWSIMVGVYEGTPEQEKQIIGTIYFPERSILLYQVTSVEGVFVLNTETGETKEISELKNQDNLSEIIISYCKHTNLQKTGKISEIESSLRQAGARLRSTNSVSADVLEALTTGGKRAMIMDGDLTTVDYIAYAFLQKMGYKLFDWNGSEMNTDQSDLSEKKIVLVPPGKAGEVIINTIRTISAHS